MAFEKIIKYSSGRAPGESRLTISVNGIYIPAKFGKIKRAHVYFDPIERRIGIEPTDDADGYIVNPRAYRLGAAYFVRKYKLPLGIRIAAEWNEDKTMIISEPIEEAA